MKSLPTWFFIVGAVSVLIGMSWGIVMSATQDHTLMPAHAHLNLIGFVVMTIYGIYYALTPQAAANGLARVHFWLALLGEVLIVPGIVMAIQEQGEMLAKVGSVVVVLAMAVFLVQLLRHGVGTRAAA